MSYPQETDSQQQPNQSRFHSWLFVGLFAGLALLPILYYGVNSEAARWRAASAELRFDAGEIESGLELMEQAVEQAPHNQSLKLAFARKLMEHKQPERALGLIETVIEYSVNPLPALQTKADCLVHLSRPDEALEQMKKATDHLDPKDYQQPARLNTMAYFRALARMELGRARQDIRKSIAQTEAQFWWMDRAYAPLPLGDQVLVAATQIALRIERSELVLGPISQRIDGIREIVRAEQDSLSGDIYSAISLDKKFDKQFLDGASSRQYALLSYRKFLSLLLMSRALIYQELGQDAKCDLDRVAVERLGFDAAELASKLPADRQLLALLDTGAAFLDTDAMVRQADGEMSEVTRREFDIAVLAVELLGLTDGTTIQNTINEDSRMLDGGLLKWREAVIRYHRAVLLRQLELLPESEADFRRIEELGFDRDDTFF